MVPLIQHRPSATQSAAALSLGCGLTGRGRRECRYRSGLSFGDHLREVPRSRLVLALGSRSRSILACDALFAGVICDADYDLGNAGS
jgi:hypothetical protein